ncbi:MAG: L,D-transpeptidase family protein, partial [Candidatus Omnitrophota bacterium]
MKFFRFVLSPRLAASRAISFIVRYCVTALRFLGIDIIRYHLFIDLRTNLLYLREGTKIIKTYHVSTGKTTTPTPTGVFVIRTKSWGYLPLYSRFTNKVIWPDQPNYPLGKGYLGGLDRRFAIHAVRAADAIGQYNSNGCIRLNSQDMQDLLHFAKVGTSVVVTNHVSSSPLGVIEVLSFMVSPMFILTIHELSHIVTAKLLGLSPRFRILNSYKDAEGNLSRIMALQSSLPNIYFQVYIGENPDIYKETLCRLAGIAVDLIFLIVAASVGIFFSISGLHKIFLAGLTAYNMLANFSWHEADNRQLCADATFILRFGRFRRTPESLQSHVTPANAAVRHVEVSSSPLAKDSVGRRKFTGIILKNLSAVGDDIAFHDADALAREILEGYRRSGLSAQEALRCLDILAPTYKGKSAAIIEELYIKLHTELLWQALRELNHPVFNNEKGLMEKKYGFTIFTFFNDKIPQETRSVWENRGEGGQITNPLADEGGKYLPFVYWAKIDQYFDSSAIDDLGICVTEWWTDILKHVPQGMGVVLVRVRHDEKSSVLVECQIIDNGEGYDIEKYMAVGETSDFPEESQEVKTNPDAHLLIEGGRGKSIVSCLVPDFIVRSQDKMFIQEGRPDVANIFGAAEDIAGRVITGLPYVKGTQKIFRMWANKVGNRVETASSPLLTSAIVRALVMLTLYFPIDSVIAYADTTNRVSVQESAQPGSLNLPVLLKKHITFYQVEKKTTVRQLAKQFNMTPELLKELNHLATDQVKAGQTLE